MNESTAVISPDKRYRYVLTRRWDETPRSLVVVGLNPSTADAIQDDPTIRRCITFAKRNLCGALVMLNLFALRATDPKALYSAEDPVGPENDAYLKRFECGDRGESLIVAAWGAHGARFHGRVPAVCDILRGLNCFGLTKHGHPRHPLYLKADTPIVAWRADGGSDG